MRWTFKLVRLIVLLNLRLTIKSEGFVPRVHVGNMAKEWPMRTSLYIKQSVFYKHFGYAVTCSCRVKCTAYSSCRVVGDAQENNATFKLALKGEEVEVGAANTHDSDSQHSSPNKLLNNCIKYNRNSLHRCTAYPSMLHSWRARDIRKYINLWCSW